MISEMMAAARRTIVLADSTKFGRRLFGQIGPLEQIQVLVTDKAPQGELSVALQEARVQVVVVNEECINPEEVESEGEPPSSTRPREISLPRPPHWCAPSSWPCLTAIPSR
jgi:hypothetical protein